MTDFDPTYPVSFAQARKGEVIVTQGYGNATKVWRPSTNSFKVSGTEAPTTAPTVSIRNTQNQELPETNAIGDWYKYITYYVARLDILNAGAGLTLPPIVTIDPAQDITPTGCPTLKAQTAQAVSRIRQKQLSEIEVTTFGRHYKQAPIVYVSYSPQLEGEDPTGGQNLELTMTTRPALNAAQGGSDDNADNFSYLIGVTLTNGGSGYSTGNSFLEPDEEGYGSPPQIRMVYNYPAGIQAGFYFKVRSEGGEIKEIDLPDNFKHNGDGTLPNGDPATGYPPNFDHTKPVFNNTISWYQNRDIIQPGDQEDFGEVQAIMRATLRGKYQCYYRYVNKTIPEDEGGPLYSNLSPLTEKDTRNGAAFLKWEIDAPNAADDWEDLEIELWRSSANQATTLFHVKTVAHDTVDDMLVWSGSSFTFYDDINDHDLTDAKRDDFLALPILLPNGELNANRFGVMSKDFAVGVMFQDRFWYGVDTSNNRPNSLMFSETDEPESCPDVNEIIIQQNLRSADYITALIPYAGALVACQSRHSHRLTYVSQPLIDVSTFLLAYRGCCSQRTWDIYEGVAYMMDEQGVYSLDPQGKLEPLTVGIDDLFQDKIDWEKRQWFIVRADRRLNVLRCLVSFKGDASKYPTRQLCYSFDYKAWWVEVYPQALVGSTDCRGTSGNVERIWGGEKGRFYRLGQGLTDDAEGAITSVTITNPGRGYKSPPTVTASGGSCAEFSVSMDVDGQITGIQVRQCGQGYSDGQLVISAPASGGTPATADYTVQNNKTPVYYSFQSGNMEFTTDTQSPKANASENRQVSVVYQPTDSSSVLNLETYYNGASYPRSNVCTRDRGTGFVHSEDVPAATLDMKKTQIQDSEAHGVARALFAGRTLDDMSGTDRHIAVGLSGKQGDAGRVTIHTVDIYGVHGGGE